MARVRPERVLVLGTRLGEFTSFWRSEFVARSGFIHVDLDPEAFGAAYPAAHTLGVQAEVGAFVEMLLEQPPEAPASRPSPCSSDATRSSARRAPGPEVRPSFLDAGDPARDRRRDGRASSRPATRSCSAPTTCVPEPGRYRVSTGFGSMGHAVAGVVGAALAREDKAVAIAGDGAMLMPSEVNTAVQYNAQAVWVVLNDARYGMIEQGMKSIGWKPFGTEIPRCDFVAIARGMGADGVRVEHESEPGRRARARDGARRAVRRRRVIDPREVVPSGVATRASWSRA